MKTTLSVLLMVSVLAVAAFTVNAQVGVPNMFRKVSDFDGDGRADFAVTRNENGFRIWYIWQSTDGFRAFHWGLGTTVDINAAGDYDGDGKTDIAIFRYGLTGTPIARHQFHILGSQSGTHIQKEFMISFAADGAPAQQDYNGDGRVDPAFFMTAGANASGTLSVIYSGNSSSGFTTSFPPGYFPIRIGDMDGDGNAEISRRHWQTLAITITNPVTGISRNISFGVWGVPQMADFDGDGIGDFTIFRPSDGTWLWLRSSDNVLNVAYWGSDGDTPVPADYDGDGKTDLAIWRPGLQGYYWINGSRNGISVFPWGISGDSAVRF